MNKIKISNIDEYIVHEKLENGLNIYIYKKEGFLKKGAYFVTNYGSSINEFKPIDEDEIRSFPLGIAHFLEHKLFESSDKENVFEKFSKYGASVNAYTNHFVTNYYFSCIDNFNECLQLLIDFVQTPYFTDENVEKEKGIINQEINMTNDDIDRFLFEELFEKTLVKNPNKYKTIGDKKNVYSITKEDLYKCYNTFYNPSNMVLAIYGDINIEETIDLIKKNQANKTFLSTSNIKIKKYNEEEKVKEEYSIFNRNIKTPKIGICYKIKIPNIDKCDKFKKSLFINMFLEMKFSPSSLFEKNLIKNKIINGNLEFTYSLFDDVILLFFIASTNKKDLFIKEVDNEIKNKNMDKKIFDINKKAYLASIVRAYENPSEIASIIFNQYFKYGKIIDNAYDIYNDYKYDEFIDEFNITNFENKAVIYITNEKKY